MNRTDRRIIALAIPALGSLAVEPLYVLVDTAIVGRLGTAQLGGLARQLQSIGLDDITFLTVPWEYVRPAYDISWVEPDASTLWRLLMEDKVLPASYTDGSITAANAPGDDPTDPATPTSTPRPEESEIDADDAEDAGLCT